MPLTTRQAVEFATVNGARTLGLDDRVGSLTPGKQADLILVNAPRSPLHTAQDATTAVTFAARRDVDTVLIAGELRKRHGVLLGADLAEAWQRAARSRDRMLATAE